MAGDWDSCITLSPPHLPIRRKSQTLQPSPQILLLKTIPWKLLESSGFFEPQGSWFSLNGPCNKSLSVPNIKVFLASLWQQTWVCNIFSGLQSLSATLKTTFVNVTFILCCRIQRTFPCPYLNLSEAFEEAVSLLFLAIIFSWLPDTMHSFISSYLSAYSLLQQAISFTNSLLAFFRVTPRPSSVFSLHSSHPVVSHHLYFDL